MPISRLRYKFLISALLILAAAGNAAAQFVTVHGSVIDDKGEPLIGAAVVNTNTNRGVATDIDGNFTFESVVTGTKLKISFIGYKPATVPAMSQMKVCLYPDNDSRQSGLISQNNTNPARTQPVDLGLSVKWADRPLGAYAVGDAGSFYSWGETSTKSMNDYIYPKYQFAPRQKYNNSTEPPKCARVNGNGMYVLKDGFDAAQSLGKGWRMPNSAEIKELVDKCKISFYKEGGHTYARITGPNGNSIRLNVCGVVRSDEGCDLNREKKSKKLFDGQFANYWGMDVNKYGKVGTLFIVAKSSSGDGYMTLSESDVTWQGRCILPVYTGNVNNNVNNNNYNNVNTAATPVDLGLSVKWSDRNVGASRPSDVGGYAAWGETEFRQPGTFTPANYAFAKGLSKLPSIMFDLDTPLEAATTNTYPIRRLLPQNDIATVKMGSNWSMPTSDEWKELEEKCTFSTVEVNGRRCIKVTGPNGNYILLPEAGYCGHPWNDADAKAENRTGNLILIDKCAMYRSSDGNRSTTDYGRVYFNGISTIYHYADATNTQLEKNTSKSFINYNFPWEGMAVRAVYRDNNNNNNNNAVTGGKATVTWIDVPESTHQPSVTVKAGIKSSSQISSVSMLVNGRTTRGIKSVRNDGYDYTVNEPVKLTAGNNVIQLTVTNGAGSMMASKNIYYMPVEENTDRNDNNDKNNAVVKTQKRVALVIGNSAYKDSPLPNPVNDASDIAATLRTLGFNVTLVKDATKRQLENALTAFSRNAANADVAMFYYAGHGIQTKGINYLIPVDANPGSEADVPYECTDANRVLSNLEASGSKLNIIALDACRNNPFGRSWHRGGGSRGLSMMDAPVGSLIAFATSPGDVAADGAGRNSPYTSALLSELRIPGQSLETIFNHVARKVFESTDRQQRPWYLSSIYQGQFIFNPK